MAEKKRGQESVAGASPADSASHPWRSPLYSRLPKQPYPLVVFPDVVIPAASLWTGARLWIDSLRAAEVRPGDRIAIALPPSPAFIQVLIAALWEGLTIVPLPYRSSAEETSALIAAVDARLTVSERFSSNDGVWRPDGVSGPDTREGDMTLRPTRHAPTPGVCFIFRQSGAFIALSSDNVWGSLSDQLPQLHLREAETRILSLLPWDTAGGILRDLLPGLLAGAEIIRVGDGWQDVTRLLHPAIQTGATHLFATPSHVAQIGEESGGAAFLRALEGGIVVSNGIPITSSLMELLMTTRLRAGYGNAEASCCLALGSPRIWPGTGYLGQTLNCNTRINPGGGLQFRGRNACLGSWTSEHGLHRLPSDRWVDTGDKATLDPVTKDLFLGSLSSDSGFETN
ncbi:MAG: acyl--CoA ligase [Fibrella sp.]|nr:acyl--CoA ligase [Armatimonadota bacterium]